MSAGYWAARGAFSVSSVFADPDTTAVVEPVRQVGRWFERVHLAALQTTPGVELLASNVPLRDGGHTLGELDAVFRVDGAVVHREVAVKYYLAAKPGDDPACWVGPGKRDRLDLKLDRLATHQLSLPTRAREAGVWPQTLPFPQRSEVLLLGAVFSPEHDVRLPRGASSGAEHGRWYSASEFASRFETQPWCVLDKPWWLSPEHARNQTFAPARAIAETLDRPLLVAAVEPALVRAFVVPDGWWADLTER